MKKKTAKKIEDIGHDAILVLYGYMIGAFWEQFSVPGRLAFLPIYGLAVYVWGFFCAFLEARAND